MLKNVKWFSIGVSLLYIAAGVLLILNPDVSEFTILNFMAYASMAVGLLSIIRYFTMPVKIALFRNGFMVGTIFIAVGIILLIFKEKFVDLAYIILAVVVMISGFSKLQDCIDAARLGSESTIAYFVLSLVSIAAGILIIVNPFTDINMTNMVIAIALLYSGVSDLFGSLFLSVKFRRYSREQEQGSQVQYYRPQEYVEPVIPETPYIHMDIPDAENVSDVNQSEDAD